VGAVSASAWWTAVAIGALACAILVANNLRDLDGDRAAGKRTLATRLGDTGTRWFFVGLVVLAVIGVFGVAATSSWWALLGWLMLLLLAGPTVEVVRGVSGRGLIHVLKRTGLAELASAAGLFVGLLIAS
jgi:1,4-dihydroxy-2-naphthoate octaprenyltransferase